MKKLMFIIGILVSFFTIPVSADQSRVEVIVHSQESIRNGLERAPLHLPSIDIIYDSTFQSIEIISSIECEASVKIYDICGELIHSSDSMDKILYLPNTDSPVLYIRIESDFWYATATIVV